MESGSASVLSLILRSIGLAGKASDTLANWRMKPGKADRDLIVKHCQWLDERRVFHAPMNVEVVEASVGSIKQARDRTAEAQASVKDAGTRAILGGLLDLFREFLDRWEGVKTPASFDVRGNGADLATFFKDLGELRARVGSLVALLAAADKRLTGLALVRRDATGDSEA